MTYGEDLLASGDFRAVELRDERTIEPPLGVVSWIPDTCGRGASFN
jgi:hypothetical protein